MPAAAGCAAVVTALTVWMCPCCVTLLLGGHSFHRRCVAVRLSALASPQLLLLLCTSSCRSTDRLVPSAVRTTAVLRKRVLLRCRE